KTDTVAAADGAAYPTYNFLMVGGSCASWTGQGDQLGWGNCQPDINHLFQYDPTQKLLHTADGLPSCVEDQKGELSGAHVIKSACTGSTNQVWDWDGNGEFHNHASGECMYAEGNSIEIEVCNGFLLSTEGFSAPQFGNAPAIDYFRYVGQI